MIQRLHSIYADVPLSLQPADQLLTEYGRWAADRRAWHRCGSAERAYRPTRGEAFEARREAREPFMATPDALRCQRALQLVPDRERLVLAILYVPHRLRVEHRLRKAHIPPKLARERHLAGLTMFAVLHRSIADRRVEA
jgi:hypothetical protein